MTQIDQRYLRDHQYRDASNLNARIALHRRFSTNSYPFTRWEFDHYVDRAPAMYEPLPEHARVLELGAGPATLWRENLTRVPSGWSITLTDLSPGMLTEARQNLGNAAARFNFREVDAQALPFEDAAFDAVIANHMLYHVPDRARALSEIARVLQPGGRLFAATNGSANMAGSTELRRLYDTDELIEEGKRINSLSFNLENGLEQLESHFSEVNISRYADSLIVDEAEPLVAYIRSGSPTLHDPEKATAFTERIRDEMVRRGGVIEIQKDVGVFIAVK